MQAKTAECLHSINAAADRRGLIWVYGRERSEGWTLGDEEKPCGYQETAFARVYDLLVAAAAYSGMNLRVCREGERKERESYDNHALVRNLKIE